MCSRANGSAIHEQANRKTHEENNDDTVSKGLLRQAHIRGANGHFFARSARRAGGRGL
jgi:hypothetical protein